MGDLQRLGFVGVAFVPRPQPARALLLLVDPDARLSVHLEETSLRCSTDNHHALLVRSGLLFFSGKKLIAIPIKRIVRKKVKLSLILVITCKALCHSFFFFRPKFFAL